MHKTLVFAATIALVAAPAGAQRAVALEGGLLAHYTKFDSRTWLDNGAGIGINLDAYILRRLALEYSGDLAKNTSKPTSTDLTVVNNRFDLVYNQPLTGKWRALLGGGWTGTKFGGDKTNNEYDSGLNALLGLRYCARDDWNWKVEAVADFKDPSDQAPAFTRTQTYTLRFGLSRFFGGQAKNGPCVMEKPAEPMPAPPPPAAQPAPQQPAAPTPQQPPAQQPPAQQPPPQPAAQPAPAPAPAAAPMRFGIVHFAFDKAQITAADRDTLDAAIRFLKANPNAKVEVTGHTDSIGTEAYNIRLGSRRAIAVRDYLVREGIATSRILTATRGESEPIADNGTVEGRAMNRRAVIVEVKP